MMMPSLICLLCACSVSSAMNNTPSKRDGSTTSLQPSLQKFDHFCQTLTQENYREGWVEVSEITSLIESKQRAKSAFHMWCRWSPRVLRAQDYNKTTILQKVLSGSLKLQLYLVWLQCCWGSSLMPSLQRMKREAVLGKAPTPFHFDTVDAWTLAIPLGKLTKVFSANVLYKVFRLCMWR